MLLVPTPNGTFRPIFDIPKLNVYNQSPHFKMENVQSVHEGCVFPRTDSPCFPQVPVVSTFANGSVLLRAIPIRPEDRATGVHAYCGVHCRTSDTNVLSPCVHVYVYLED